MNMIPADLARARFADVFQGDEPDAIAVAPGRVNLIGEHTDYNDGFVLPMAINLNVAVAVGARSDNTLRAHSAVSGESREARIEDLRAPGGSEWFDYVAGVAWAVRGAGAGVSGMDMAIAGDVPVGAGLASSAALELAVARAICHASSHAWDPVHMATICQRAENLYVGVNCGIMDQFAAAVCSAGSALLLDCRNLEHTPVQVPSGAVFVVMDTGVRRSLAASEYNDRRESCEAAVAVLRQVDPDVRSLRDVDLRMLSDSGAMLDDTLERRATHVVTENSRTVRMADALRSGDLALAGKLMSESHSSLSYLYEVSCGELNLITSFASEHDACYGARMTGAGFGGCAVALVAQDRADAFVSDVTSSYEAKGERRGTMHICTPAGGAALV